MKLLILLICFLLFFNYLDAQTDSLSQYSLAKIDSIYRTKQQPKDQLPYALALLQKGEKELNTKDTIYAKLLYKISNTYLSLRDYSNAKKYLEQAISIWEAKMPIHAAHGNCLHILGAAFYYQKKNEEAEKYWLQSLAIREKVFGEQHLDCARSLHNLGILYYDMGDYYKGERYYLQALNMRKKLLDESHPDCAASYNSLGILYGEMGYYSQAEAYYHQSLNSYKKTLGENHPLYAGCLNNLVTLYIVIGEYSKAENYAIQSLNIKKKVLGEEDIAYGIGLSNLGSSYHKMGNYSKAKDCYLQALSIIKKVLGEEHNDYASCLANLGALNRDIGEYEEAVKLSFQVLNIIKKNLGEQHPRYALLLHSIISNYIYMKDYSKAEEYTLQAIDIIKKVLGEEHPEYATSLLDLGILYGRVGEYSKAENYLLQCLNIRKKIFGEEHPDYAGILSAFGLLYKEMGEYSKSEGYYLQALNIRKKVFGKEHYKYANELINLGRLYNKMGNYAKANEYYTTFFNNKNRNIATNFSWLSEKGKAAYWDQEDGFYGELNDYAAQAAATYPQAAVLAYNSNLISKGLLLESAKEIESAVVASKDSITIQIYKDLKEKRILVNQLISSGASKKNNLQRYETEADSLDKILVGRLGEYATSKRKFQITWKDVQTTLAEDEMAIEFTRFFNYQDSQYYYMALLLRKDYEFPKLVKLGSEKNIEAIPAGKGFADLYKLIWEPIDSFLNDVKTVYYSPDGVLNNIAFAALCSKGTEKVVNTKEINRGSISKTVTETANCTYLSERYTLRQLFITRYLADGLKTTKMDNSLLVFGGVDYDEIPSTGDTLAEVQVMDFDDYALAENINRSSNSQNRMEYLPGTQTELQNLQKIMHKKQWKIRAFSDRNASENTLKTEIQKESPSILHIATHGFAFPDIEEKNKELEEDKSYRASDNPMARCGLLLAGANHSWVGNSKNVLSQTGEDGILTALEVSNLPLKNTKLVVLSACETGLGKIQGTEGVFGLKRGFKLALVEQIIVSLWSVPDKETMELMDIFYNDLAKTHNAVISFEKAQKDMRKKYATRPDLWAGFVLVR